MHYGNSTRKPYIGEQYVERKLWCVDCQEESRKHSNDPHVTVHHSNHRDLSKGDGIFHCARHGGGANDWGRKCYGEKRLDEKLTRDKNVRASSNASRLTTRKFLPLERLDVNCGQSGGFNHCESRVPKDHSLDLSSQVSLKQSNNIPLQAKLTTTENFRIPNQFAHLFQSGPPACRSTKVLGTQDPLARHAQGGFPDNQRVKKSVSLGDSPPGFSSIARTPQSKGSALLSRSKSTCHAAPSSASSVSNSSNYRSDTSIPASRNPTLSRTPPRSSGRY